jgi:hypothetical protein
MTLNEARKTARLVERGLLRAVPRRNPDFDRVREAFHKLHDSDPANVELRREDMRLAAVIWAAAGYREPQHMGLCE